MDSKQFREWFRSIRFFERQRGWYFLSPDGFAVGPYPSERSAGDEAARLARVLKHLDSAHGTHAAVIEFTLEGSTAAA